MAMILTVLLVIAWIGFALFGVATLGDAETVIHQILGMVAFCVSLLALLGALVVQVLQRMEQGD